MRAPPNAEAELDRKRPAAARDGTPQFEPGVLELLDHIAEELALEYVRLMEKAAYEQALDEPVQGEA